MTIRIQMLTDALGYALLHSFWQCFLLYILLVLVLKLIPIASSRLRYNLSLVVMAGAFVWFADTFMSYWQHMQGVVITIVKPVDQTLISQTINTTIKTGQVTFGKADNLVSRLEEYFPYMVVLYMCGIVFLLCRFTINIFRIRAYNSKGIVQPNPEQMELFYHWKEKFQIAPKVKLLLSERINIPMMIGVIKPVILIPLATVTHLSPEQFEAILMHEMAHIKRRDYLVNIIQTLIETILFFNPFIKFISSQVRTEREHCCDDIVLEHILQPLSYAKALASLDFLRRENLAMAATGHKNQLLNRIKRMMEMKKSTNRFSMLPAILLVVVIGMSLLWLAPVLAQSKKEKDSKEATEKNVSKTKIVITDDDGKEKTYNSFGEISAKDRKELEKELAESGINVKELELEIDEAIASANEAIKSVDVQKTVSEAMNGVDWKEINDEVKQAMNESKIAMKESKVAIDEASKAMALINWDSLSNVINLAVKTSQAAISAINFDSLHTVIAAAMDTAREEMANARVVMKSAKGSSKTWTSNSNGKHSTETVEYSSNSYDKMLSKMEQDGLINRSEPFEIEKKRGVLYINGDEQSETVYNKYEKYLKGKRITIAGDKDNLNINVNN